MRGEGSRRGGAGVALLIGVAVVLAAFAVGGWLYVSGRLAPEPPMVEVSEEAADAASAKLAALAAGDAETVRLSSAELTSLARHRLRDRIPGDLHEPTVSVEEGRVRLTGRVPSDVVPEAMIPGGADFILPDTADVDVRGTLRPLGPGRVAFRVAAASFAGMPIADAWLGRALAGAGRVDEPGLGGDEIAVALPAGAASARVEGDALVLSR